MSTARFLPFLLFLANLYSSTLPAEAREALPTQTAAAELLPQDSVHSLS